VLITGGDGGLMRVVSEAAFKEGGMTVGIMAVEMEGIAGSHPWNNPYNRVVIRSGQSFTSRSSIVVRSSDAIILVAGGVGSLAEVAMAYNMKKPVVVLKGTGMIADRLVELFPTGSSTTGKWCACALRRTRRRRSISRPSLLGWMGKVEIVSISSLRCNRKLRALRPRPALPKLWLVHRGDPLSHLLRICPPD